MKKAAKRCSKAGPLKGALSVKGRVTWECVRTSVCARALTEVEALIHHCLIVSLSPCRCGGDHKVVLVVEVPPKNRRMSLYKPQGKRRRRRRRRRIDNSTEGLNMFGKMSRPLLAVQRCVFIRPLVVSLLLGLLLHSCLAPPPLTIDRQRCSHSIHSLLLLVLRRNQESVASYWAAAVVTPPTSAVLAVTGHPHCRRRLSSR